jgi:hypothetical protein
MKNEKRLQTARAALEDSDVTKRTAGKFERRERDLYPTPPPPIWKLTPHLFEIDTFAEPMCGDGAIVRVLEALGWHCPWASDIQPLEPIGTRARQIDVLRTDLARYKGCDAIISNPPWPMPSNKLGGLPAGTPTVQIISHLMQFKPTWMLLAADFMHNAYFAPLASNCVKIVSVGRVKWMPDSKNTGFDNAAWYLFDAEHKAEGPVFLPSAGTKMRYHHSIEGVL